MKLIRFLEYFKRMAGTIHLDTTIRFVDQDGQELSLQSVQCSLDGQGEWTVKLLRAAGLEPPGGEADLDQAQKALAAAEAKLRAWEEAARGARGHAIELKQFAQIVNYDSAMRIMNDAAATFRRLAALMPQGDPKP